jgi:hypothetical protein
MTMSWIFGAERANAAERSAMCAIARRGHPRGRA